MTNDPTLGGSDNFSFTLSTPELFDWKTSSSGNNGDTTMNTSSTYGTGITVNSSQNKTNYGSTMLPITTTSAANFNLTNLGFAITCPTCFNTSNMRENYIKTVVAIHDQVTFEKYTKQFTK